MKFWKKNGFCFARQEDGGVMITKEDESGMQKMVVEVKAGDWKELVGEVSDEVVEKKKSDLDVNPPNIGEKIEVYNAKTDRLAVKMETVKELFVLMKAITTNTVEKEKELVTMLYEETKGMVI